MKFEYDGMSEARDMVAFIDDEGDLCIKSGDGLVYLLLDGTSVMFKDSDISEYAENNGVKKAFYPGDKITITF